MLNTRIAALISASGASSGDADAAAWVAAVIAAGGTVSSGQIALVTALVQGLKADGVWSSLDRLWLFAAENSTQARRDLVARVAATASNGPTFTANRGYTSDGLSSYVDPSFNFSTDGVKYTQNSASIFAYINTTRAASDGDVIGSNYGSVQTVLSARFTGNIAGGNLNNAAAAGSATGAVSDPLGLTTLTRTSSTALTAYKRGSSIGTASSTSSAPPNGIATILCINGASQFETARCALAGWGAGLTAAQVAALNARVETYMTAIGANA